MSCAAAALIPLGERTKVIGPDRPLGAVSLVARPESSPELGVQEAEACNTDMEVPACAA